MWPTDTVEPGRLQHRRNVFGIPLPRLLVLRTVRESGCIAPATNGNHHLRVRPEALAHGVRRLEGFEGWRRVGIEELRRRKAHDGVVDALSLVFAWEVGDMISSLVVC